MLALNRPSRRHDGRGAYFLLLVFTFFLTIFSCYSPLSAQKTGRGTSSFTTHLINLEATAKETFRYNASLYNGSKRTGIYALHAAVPEGWNVAFKAEGMQVTSLKLDSNKTQSVSIELTPGPGVKPGKYEIAVTAISDADSLLLNLEAVVKGAYALTLTTPSGRLSDQLTEGSRKPIHLTVKNTGTLSLRDLSLSAQSPSKWETTFEPSKVEQLDPGKSIDIVAYLQVPDKTIAGDYMTTFTVKNSNANAEAPFRFTITTSWLAGWLGMLVILIAVGIIYYLIRKYGRR